MNYHHAEREDYADILSRSKVLHTSDLPGFVRVHVAQHAGNDVLIIQETLTGNVLVIESDDENYGGSIHDHARHCIAAGLL